MDHKIGVYIDTGYGIGEALDIEALSNVATDEFKVLYARRSLTGAIRKNWQLSGTILRTKDSPRLLLLGRPQGFFKKEFTFENVIRSGSISGNTSSGAIPRMMKIPRCSPKITCGWGSPKPVNMKIGLLLQKPSGKEHSRDRRRHHRS